MYIMIPLVLCLCLSTSLIQTAPLQIQLLQPMLQPQQTSLQQQLMALQQLQALKRLNGQLPSLNLPRPLLILLPNSHRISDINQTPIISNLRIQDPKTNNELEDDESDSVIIDAEPTDTPILHKQETQKAVLLLPNDGRFSIGGFISSIPFLPIEINVPDSISWIYNGISSIISGIGQRLPFRPQTLDALDSTNQNEGSMMIKSLDTRRVTPILVMPMGQPFSIYQ